MLDRFLMVYVHFLLCAVAPPVPLTPQISRTADITIEIAIQRSSDINGLIL